MHNITIESVHGLRETIVFDNFIVGPQSDSRHTSKSDSDERSVEGERSLDQSQGRIRTSK
ncbi:hypothetical protein N9N28_10185 [Rubripirellula amarantea]|uniref:Uncharacterized protein n=1 Tax=Rubripirellula amarantea TaxID=2527999 RepID=A0A5C5WQC0_9BACT|nr:hypothetical protein [Rubripirellula amarantea]MDA8744988.1 hypothetical protein [Rubripirellula amarantea]TWT52858.1 hypothetical protein Pla22_04860 [Rubripirellula amarantea]